LIILPPSRFGAALITGINRQKLIDLMIQREIDLIKKSVDLGEQSRKRRPVFDTDSREGASYPVLVLHAAQPKGVIGRWGPSYTVGFVAR
jgi:hypothetical protein